MKKCPRRLLVTGGAGFIGSSFIRIGLRGAGRCDRLVNLDLLTYSGNLDYLEEIAQDPRYRFVHGNICDQELVESICLEEKITGIVHFAAESHVDRSIASSQLFYETNVGGTISLLEVVRRHPDLHFHHISTDEVYGTLSLEGKFREDSPYHPNSPYAASKASSDHFVQAYAHTYRLLTTISHCTNNYGPCQHVEKFIPSIITSCMQKLPISIYGEGKQIRDWIFVDDHSEAIWLILERGTPGEVYNIGGGIELRNLDLAYAVIDSYSKITGKNQEEYRSLIRFVPDRLGHDFRYAVDFSKIKDALGWSPTKEFQEGINETVKWYKVRRSTL